MIYLFQGCKAVLICPFACVAVICQPIGRCLEATLNCIGDIFGPISRNPLGGYVMATLVMAVLACLGAGLTVNRVMQAERAIPASADVASPCDGTKMYSYAVIAIAFVHAAFAVYIQRRLVKTIGKDGEQNMTFSEIVVTARHVALYDFGFCFYVPFFVGAFGYTCYGLSALDKCGLSGWAWSAGALIIFYQFVAANYAVCWMGCNCCCGKVEELTGRDGGQGQPPVVVGQPV
eukprot:TRINITY_DN10295_c0_g2_i1.p1 TRINITY_DN10295_c0_g2~~TRINITY_DN10295_c0_g2_i1.p1  ORF type:complete len:233 (-),score=25.79 TRINITY_DN10295_c0_g2_i1:197-895(-)